MEVFMIYRVVALAAVILIHSQTAQAQEPERWFATTIVEGWSHKLGPFPSLQICDARLAAEISRLEIVSKDALESLKEDAKTNSALLNTDEQRAFDAKVKKDKSDAVVAAKMGLGWTNAICDRH
jgi:hypothetical protein